MTALPIEAGPSRTMIGAIDWFARFGATLLSNPDRSALELAPEARDQVASLLLLYELLDADHDAWVSRIPAPGPAPTDRDMLRRYAAAFQKWHATASSILHAGQKLAAGGYEIPRLSELQDRIGFCPYVGLSVDEWMARQNGPEGPVTSWEKIRDGLRHRLHAAGR
jgi:hypothetical protein